jgi:hypothetical protein
VCVGVAQDGYFIYDDLLSLTPGGWQGGFVSNTSPVFVENFKSLCEKVPIFILELVDTMQHQPLEIAEHSKNNTSVHSMVLRSTSRK